MEQIQYLEGGPSQGHAQWSKYRFNIYNPDDIAAVVQGKKQPSEVQPVYMNDYRNSPMLNNLYIENRFPPHQTRSAFPLLGANEGGDHWQMIMGSVYDPVDRRLYVLIRFGLHQAENEGSAIVHVFQLK